MKTTTTDRAALLALFLLDTTGSVFGTWEGRLPAAEQRSAPHAYLTDAEREHIGDATEVLLDLGAITEGDAETLDQIAAVGRYRPRDADLVRMALESYADAHGAASE